jgi:tripartite-type tricarboxylate transporter receptor subunit TctC
MITTATGGGNDFAARLLAAGMTSGLGQQVIVDNRSSTVVPGDIVSKSPPDGYTILLGASTFTLGPLLIKNSPYDPVRDFAPITLAVSSPNILVVHPSVAATSVKELIALAKAKPNTVVYATAGIGSFQHFASELFRTTAGLSMVHVPYKGGGPAMIDTIAGQAHMSLGSLIQFLPHFRSGKLKPLGTGGAKRTAILPDVPTIAESLPGYEANNWWGILAPAATPAAIVKKLNAEINAIMKLPETQKRFASEGAEPVSGTPEDFSKLIASEMIKWAKVAKEANIKAE